MRVIIIGAGLIGVSTAYFLNQNGHEVLVLDRKEGPGMDTSFANGGMLTPSQAEPWNQPGIFWKAISWIGDENSPFLLRPGAIFSIFGWGIRFIRNSTRARYYLNMKKNARLASYSIGVLRDLREKHTLNYDANINGTLKFFNNRKEFDEVIEHSRYYEELGITYRLLDAREVIDLEPSLKNLEQSIAGGIHYPDDESGDAHKFCSSVADLAQHQGVEFQFGIDVKRLESTGNKITAVNTSTGRHTGDVYVLAAGSYSTLLAGLLKIRLPIRPVKGYSLTIDTSGWDDGPGMPVVDESRHIALVPLGSRLRVAGTAELNGYNDSPRRSRIQNLCRYVNRVYPDLYKTIEENSLNEWAGLRPYTCDGVPIIDRTHYENLYLNTGHGHLGWTMAAGSGRLAADLISGNKPDLDPEPYGLLNR